LGKSIKELNPISPFVKAKESHPFDEDSEYLPSIERAKADANELMERRAKERKEKIINYKLSKGYEIMELLKKIKEILIKVKDIATTIFGLIGALVVFLQEYYATNGSPKWYQVVLAAVIFIIGWFTGKKPKSDN